ncbi:MAG TPA: protoporphyrinogen oxidase HemJ [Gemmatimonadales bacterium]|nr:protoporphyrinogen oxidase HemJ [Gemmatimonadales bacterium]
MLYLWLKAFHIVGMVSWFAGLFYLGRLFVYHAEALAAPEPKRQILSQQYAVMESRLYRLITTPAMGLTLLTGLGMLATPAGHGWLPQPWLHAKLALVALLVGLHFHAKRVMVAFAEGRMRRSGEWFRLYNEGPTLVLVAVSILAVFKSAVPWGGLGAALTALVVLILLAYRAYARRRHASAARSGTAGSERAAR